MSPADVLDADAISAALFGQRLGSSVMVLEKTSSTNDVVFRLAPEKAEGLVVFAEHQTAGRGQHGRSWESTPRKGLWFSILLRPGIELVESPRLTNWAAETIALTLRDYLSLGAEVKPPNDVYIGNRKIAGVLLEMRAVAGAAHLGILGLGINVNQTTEDFSEDLRRSAGSLAIATARQIDRQALAIAILRNLNRTYREAITV